jgi:hypothetical protein
MLALPQADRMIIDISYLDKGLVPSGDVWSNSDGDHIKACLDNLSPEASRSTRRKFRKIFRRAVKWQLANIKSASEANRLAYRESRSIAKDRLIDQVNRFRNNLGLNSKGRLTPHQRSSRRRLVRTYMEYARNDPR